MKILHSMRPTKKLPYTLWYESNDGCSYQRFTNLDDAITIIKNQWFRNNIHIACVDKYISKDKFKRVIEWDINNIFILGFEDLSKKKTKKKS